MREFIYGAGSGMMLRYTQAQQHNAGLDYIDEAAISSPDLLASPEPGHKQNFNN